MAATAEKDFPVQLEAGRVEGREAGAQEARDRVAAETVGVKSILEEVGASLHRKRVELEGLAERELVRLAISIAGRIVKVEIEANADAIAPANVHRAVELAARRHGIVVRVNPKDLVAVKEHLPGVVAAFPETEGIRLQADAKVASGGCVVVTEEGAVDAEIATQLDEIERSLLG